MLVYEGHISHHHHLNNWLINCLFDNFQNINPMYTCINTAFQTQNIHKHIDSNEAQEHILEIKLTMNLTISQCWDHFQTFIVIGRVHNSQTIWDISCTNLLTIHIYLKKVTDSVLKTPLKKASLEDVHYTKFSTV